MPALVLALWLGATLGWWAFAFMPLPAAPPAWLTVARVACFGAMERGLPDAAGWMMLVLAPASFLVGVAILWGAELAPALARVARRPLGRALLGVVAVAVATEGVWVAGKVQAARVVTTFTADALDEQPLPDAYPRQRTPAPPFTLVDQHGADVSLAGLAGRPVVLTFVFAHCQTTCPLIVSALRRGVPADTEVLLVTLDPWRDTPSALPGIAARWGLPAGFRVLSARSVEQVTRVAAAYGVTSARDERTGDIVHPGLVFVIDRDGRLAYTFNTPPATWVRESLQRLGRPHAAAG
jgi:cytochrome oxidase Cu insertion factor (SCO1/SenC/PrrC family)